MESTFSSITTPDWIGFWFRIEFLSIIIIGFGCAGELIAEAWKFSDKIKIDRKTGRLEKKVLASEVRERFRRRSIWIVVFGLAIELIAFGFSYVASNREILALQMQLQPRTITDKQIEEFSSFLKHSPKFPIWVVYDVRSDENKDFVKRVRKLLDDAGYNLVKGDAANSLPKTPVPGFLKDGIEYVDGTFFLTAPDITSPKKADVFIVHSGDLSFSVTDLCAAFVGLKNIHPITLSVDGLKNDEIFVFICSKQGF